MKCLMCENPVSVRYADHKVCSYECEQELSNKLRKIRIEKNNELSKIIKPIPRSSTRYDIGIYDLEEHIETEKSGLGKFELNPDFQRGVVWSQDQQIAYIESLLKGKISESLRTITINRLYEDERVEDDFFGVCVIDGLQRLTSLIKFSKGEFNIFNNQLSHEDLKKSSYSLACMYVKFQVMEFKRKNDVLEYYIDINTGGTVHTDDELKRVRSLIK